MQFDKDTAIKAGVKAKHIARLLGVSRFTANNWLSGRRHPHDLIRDRVSVFMAALNDAIDDGDLPIQGNDDALPEEQSVRLLRVLKERMDKTNN